MAENEVAKREENLPAEYDFGDDFGGGFENQTAEELQIPFLVLLQDGSPQVKPHDEKYVEGAESGMLMNSVTNELYGTQVLFHPAVLDVEYVEWIPKNQGGGLVARHDKDSPFVKETLDKAGTTFGRIKTEKGNHLVKTVYLYGIVWKSEVPEFVVLPLSSTKLTPFRKWNTKINAFTVEKPGGGRATPSLWFNLVRVGRSDKPEVRKQGTSWNLKLTPANGEVGNSVIGRKDPRYKAILELRNLIKSGGAKMAEETREESPGAEAGAEVFG